MIISLTYDEISRLVRERSGREIGISYKDADTLTLSFEASIPIPIISNPLTRRMTADIRVEELAPPRAVLQVDAGKAGNMALDFASRMIMERLPAGLVESISGGRIEMNLNAVPRLESLFKRIEVKGLTFYGSSLSLEAELKSDFQQ